MNERNKRALLIGGILLGCFILIQYIWLPTINKINSTEKSIARKKQELPRTETLATEIKKAQQAAPKKAGKDEINSLLPWLERQVKQQNLNQYVEKSRGLRTKDSSFREKAEFGLVGISMTQLMPLLDMFAKSPELVIVSSVIKQHRKGGLQFSAELGLM